MDHILWARPYSGALQFISHQSSEEPVRLNHNQCRKPRSATFSLWLLKQISLPPLFIKGGSKLSPGLPPGPHVHTCLRVTCLAADFSFPFPPLPYSVGLGTKFPTLPCPLASRKVQPMGGIHRRSESRCVPPFLCQDALQWVHLFCGFGSHLRSHSSLYHLKPPEAWEINVCLRLSHLFYLTPSPREIEALCYC